MQFLDLPLAAPLQQAITAIGYVTPTPIQTGALPLALAGRDIIGTANTGTGKTVAFVLPILQRLLTQPPIQTTGRGRTRALILTPTRELAEQIQQAIRQLAQFTTLRSATVYGGVGMVPQERALRDGVEIIVACPGRLIDHLQRGSANLEQVEALVIDEADRMLDMGFLPSVKRILARLPRSRQTMLFSATFAPELQQLAEQTLRDPARVDAGFGAPARTVDHAFFPVSPHLKTALLLELLGQTSLKSVLIFTRTKHRANRLALQLQKSGHPVGVLHSGRSQNQRQASLDGFRAGKIQMLVATDIAARGLDIESISHVMNYDIPDTADTYIHRIGRTGRAERDGDALTLITSEDHGTVRDIERALKSTIERRTVPGFNYQQSAPPVAAIPEGGHSQGGRSFGRGGQGARSNGQGGRSNGQGNRGSRDGQPSRAGREGQGGRDEQAGQGRRDAAQPRRSSEATENVVHRRTRPSGPVGGNERTSNAESPVTERLASRGPVQSQPARSHAPGARVSTARPDVRQEASAESARPARSASSSAARSEPALGRLWPHLESSNP